MKSPRKSMMMKIEMCLDVNSLTLDDGNDLEMDDPQTVHEEDETVGDIQTQVEVTSRETPLGNASGDLAFTCENNLGRIRNGMKRCQVLCYQI